MVVIKMKKIISFVVFTGIIFSTIGIYAVYNFYNITNNSDQEITNENISISINNIKFNGENLSRIYDVNITIFIQSNINLEVKYGCSSPFQVKIVNSSLVTFSHSDFDCIRTFNIPVGKSEWFFTGQFAVKENFDIPGEFVFRLILGNNIASSNNTILPIDL